MPQEKKDEETVFVMRKSNPTKDGVYITSHGTYHYSKSNNFWTMFRWFEGSNNKPISVAWWLEELPLPTAERMFSLEDMQEAFQTGKVFQSCGSGITFDEFIQSLAKEQSAIPTAERRAGEVNDLHEAFVTAMKIDETKSIYEHLQIAFDWFKTKIQSPPPDAGSLPREQHALTNLLDDTDEFLRHLENFTHGKTGDNITELRYRIRNFKKQFPTPNP